MLLTITAVSTEVEDFAIELQIESDATFQTLHDLIRKSCGWNQEPSTHKPATFYVCDDRWRRSKTIPEKSFEEDTMDEVELGDHLEDEGQRLQYVFDHENERLLLLEVSHIAYGKHIDEPCCRRSHGNAPTLSTERTDSADVNADSTKQRGNALTDAASLLGSLNAAALAAASTADDDDELDPSDDELFDMDEIDLEGFDFSEE